MPSKVWIDGKLFDKDDAKVSVFDHGLLFGDGVSAGMRVYGGRVFALNDHLSLLYESATVFTLTIPLSLNDLARVVEETARSNGRAEGYVRLMVTRGAGTLGLDPRKCDPTVIIIAEDLIPYPRELYDSGLEVHTFGPGDPVRHPCTLSRIDAVFVKAAAIQNGCLEPILLDKACSVIGTADGEVFAVFGNSLKHSTAPGGVDRVAFMLQHDLGAATPPAVADVLVLPMGDGLDRAAGQVGRLARVVRSTAVDYSRRSLRAKMKAADKTGARWAAIMNAEEAERRVVQLRDLVSGDQREVAWDALAEALA